MKHLGLLVLLLLAIHMPELTAQDLPDDQQLVTKISQGFASNETYQDALIQVHSVRGFILLTGQVTSEEARAGATNTVVFASNAIRRIVNELVVVPEIDNTSAQADLDLQTAVEAELALMDAALAQRVEVVVHQAVVFLLGALTREEQSQVATKASTVKGVANIKTVFEAIQTD